MYAISCLSLEEISSLLVERTVLEKQHYQNVWENILKDKDLERQNILIERLNCFM